jgi:hypothetical protein
MDRLNQNTKVTEGLDLALIAQRIQELAQLAAREHLESIGRSQAEGLYRLAGHASHNKPTGTWR